MNLIKKSCGPEKNDYEEGKLIDDILEELKLSREDYEVLAMSDGEEFLIHLKRPQNSCFVSSYFKDELLAWNTNTNIQSVFNHKKAVRYINDYLSKTKVRVSML